MDCTRVHFTVVWLRCEPLQAQEHLCSTGMSSSCVWPKAHCTLQKALMESPLWDSPKPVWFRRRSLHGILLHPPMEGYFLLWTASLSSQVLTVYNPSTRPRPLRFPCLAPRLGSANSLHFEESSQSQVLPSYHFPTVFLWALKPSGKGKLDSSPII